MSIKTKEVEDEDLKMGLWLEKKYKTKAVNEFISLHYMMEFSIVDVDRHVWDWKVQHIKNCWHEAMCSLDDYCDKKIDSIGNWIEKRVKSQLSDEEYKLIVNIVNIRLEENLF